MNFVEPIRNPQTVNDIGDYLRRKNERDYMMYMLGIYGALRISDVVKIKVKDIRNRKSILLREEKTSKQKILVLNPVFLRELKHYIEDKNDDDYIIKSREGYNKPISRVRAWQIVNEAASLFGVENIGSHSLRKTFGFHYYIKTKDVVTLQKIFNHSHPSITLRYIGIDQDTVNQAMSNFKI